MSNINTGRVVIGGLLAGLVLNIGEWLLNEVVLANQMKDFFSAHKFQQPGGNFIAIAVTLTFLMGIVVVLTYALIRPRSGPGPKTAIIAGLISWFGVYVYTGILQGMLFETPMNYLAIGTVWGLVQYTVAGIAGAWAYKEA